MDSARQLAQLAGRLVQLLKRGVEQLGRLLGVARDPLSRQAQVDAERHQPLLSAVVQVSLEPPPLLISGLHDA